ncbi:lipoprotein [Sulfurovum mangrovi]|uniref:lipoprotein n=1 Tax=Sulfurovum mangrovi TaxID=2893889 RepID=UPI001E4A84EE|nr:lipoprotein [Sulfurovum mangrovi]UFH58778.1 lipoprotein [Sulfurovum mangrovi]
MKKIILAFLSLFILTACGEQPPLANKDIFIKKMTKNNLYKKGEFLSVYRCLTASAPLGESQAVFHYATCAITDKQVIIFNNDKDYLENHGKKLTYLNLNDIEGVDYYEFGLGGNLQLKINNKILIIGTYHKETDLKNLNILKTHGVKSFKATYLIHNY